MKHKDVKELLDAWWRENCLHPIDERNLDTVTTDLIMSGYLNAKTLHLSTKGRALVNALVIAAATVEEMDE